MLYLPLFLLYSILYSTKLFQLRDHAIHVLNLAATFSRSRFYLHVSTLTFHNKKYVNIGRGEIERAVETG